MHENDTTVAFRPTTPAQASVICWELLQLPPSEREQGLVDRCRGDEALLEEVRERMKRSAPEDFLERGETGEEGPQERDVEERNGLRPGDRLGNYRIDRLIQRGGMGEVYKAERVEPYKKTVAIKVIKPDVVDPVTLDRFVEERQILADLDHPNIAQIYGGGVTPSAQPYCVMQYVDGKPLGAYCREKRLTIRQRVELFLQISSAVEYAHRNLIVHRDLKPANILVTEDGRPLLLDFGIAKALNDTPPEVTGGDAGSGDQTDGFVGTWLYSSPEQIGGQRISTSSDIYSLGVLLYQCLCGHLPEDLQSKWRRIAVGDEPLEPPSAAIDRDASLAESICRERRSKDPEALKRALRGDLDAIVLKALHTQPEERYATIEQLSGDLKRYLGRRVVMARERTITYVCRKFIQRHKIAVAAVFSLIALVATVVGVTSYYEHEKTEMRGVVEKLVYADSGQLTAESLETILDAYGDEAWLASFLHKTGLELEDEGRPGSAAKVFAEALAMKERLYGDEHEELVPTLTQLAGVLAKTGGFAEAEALYLRDQNLRLAHYGPDSLEVSRGQHNLAVLYQDVGRLEEASELLEESYRIRLDLGDAGGLAATRNAMAWLRYLEGRPVEAEQLYLEVLESLAESESSLRYERTARVHRNLALVYRAQGQLREAEAHARLAWQSFRDRHLYWRVADAESVLGAILLDQGRLEEARLLLEESYPIIKSVKGEDARQTREAHERLQEGRRRFPAPTKEG